MKTDTEIQHTPGPWKVAKSCHVRESFGGLFYHVAHVTLADDSSEIPLICDVGSRGNYTSEKEAYTASPEQQANARLIAAAPDMLEALEAIKALAEQKKDYPHMDLICRAMMRISGNVIEKATNG